ncbi:uncharacterized protein LOC121754431 [Salvia splendens]|uniref:uncharacterized protein LOC121754431 n=1 Tax=Salvia splendens TaxID=180675 RepID=UPI001C2788FE|nr:uncharacterized protein LOC121754431 [Salvia splendens]
MPLDIRSLAELNTDGVFSTSTLEAGEGGLVSGSNGGLLWAFCSPVTASSSFEAELMALIRDLEMAMEFSTHIWIELDSAALVTLQSSGQLGSADLRHHMALIPSMTYQLQVRSSHIYREGHRATDFLAVSSLTLIAWRIPTCGTSGLLSHVLVLDPVTFGLG